MSSQAQSLLGGKKKQFKQMDFDPNKAMGNASLKGALGNTQFSSQPNLTTPSPQPQATQGGNQFQGSKKGPTAALEGPINRQSLSQGGFLGKAGRVKFDPTTGAFIKKKDRMKAGKFAIHEAGQSDALDEAKNLDLESGLPEGPDQAIADLIGTGGAVVRGGENLVNAGQGTTRTAIESLLGTRDTAANQAGNEAATREAALAEVSNLQRQALSPELDAATRAEFQQRADARRSEVQGIEGGMVDAFQRGRASDLAKLSASGVLDSTTGSNALGERERRLAQDIFGLNQQANETSRQEQLGERTRIGETAGQFGGLQSQQAGTAGSLLSSLIGTEAGIGQSIGSIGQGQSSIGADLIGAGIGATGKAGDLGLGNRGQEADIDLAELGTKVGASQTELANLIAIRDSDLNVKLTKEQARRLAELEAAKEGGGGALGTAIGGGLGFAVGGPAGAAIGAGIGSKF
tara:strand:+ start:13125 stop:14510 length:1386 start_codon:yes stop_codon:yes gene_type:complete